MMRDDVDGKASALPRELEARATGKHEKRL